MTVLNHKTSELARGSRTEPALDRSPRNWTSMNWALALLAAFGAALVTMVALAPVMDAVGCSTAACPSVGTHKFVFDVLYYGAPAVGGATLLASFFTAAARRGIIVPLCAGALLLADVVAVAILFGG